MIVITSLAPPGVVIQLDGHGAVRLAMTFPRFIPAIAQAPRLLPALAMKREGFIA